MQAKPKFVCRSWCLFMYTCPHCDRVIFQSNLSMAVGLSLQRLDHVAVQQHKLVPREKFKVSQLIGRTGRHLPTETGGWRSIPRTGPPWATCRGHQEKSKHAACLGHSRRLHVMLPHPLCSICTCSRTVTTCLNFQLLVLAFQGVTLACSAHTCSVLF